MLDHFASSRLRISGAESDIVDIKNALEAFGERNPCSVVSELDAQRANYIHKFVFAGPLPNVVTLRAIGLIEHLRAALDICGSGAATAHGKNGKRASKFPFGDTAAEVKNNVEGGGKNLPDDIKTLFCSFKPYKGGNDLLWALNQLANCQKHDIIIPANVDMVTGTLDRILEGEGTLLDAEWDSAKNEIPFAITAVDRGKITYDFDLRFTIAFGEVDVVKGKPAFAVFRALIGIVTGIVDATEAECRRIGII